MHHSVRACACMRASQCECTSPHLWIYTQDVLWMAGFGATQGCWQGGDHGDRWESGFPSGEGRGAHKQQPCPLSRTTAVCLQGESLQVVQFYSSWQVSECPLRRERFEPGIKLWAGFQVSSKNSQSSPLVPSSLGRMAERVGSHFSVAPPPQVSSLRCLNSPAQSQDADKAGQGAFLRAEHLPTGTPNNFYPRDKVSFF